MRLGNRGPVFLEWVLGDFEKRVGLMGNIPFSLMHPGRRNMARPRFVATIHKKPPPVSGPEVAICGAERGRNLWGRSGAGAGRKRNFGAIENCPIMGHEMGHFFL